MNTDTSTATNSTPDYSQETNTVFLEQQRERAKAEAAALEARLKELRKENDEAASGPSNVLKNARGSRWLRATKKVVGWTLVTGGAVLVGAYVYSRLRSSGVDVPTGTDVGDGVASVIDMATA